LKIQPISDVSWYKSWAAEWEYAANMGNEWRPKSGARWYGSLPVFILPALLSACAVTPNTAAAGVAAPPTDPILQAVAIATPANPAGVTTPTGPATVTVTSDYVSAAGNECRVYVVAANAAVAPARLACRDGAVWRDIPPLTSAVTESGVP
jgi:hypothetical protein